jgi:hypothetical protein
MNKNFLKLKEENSQMKLILEQSGHQENVKLLNDIEILQNEIIHLRNQFEIQK